MFFKLLLSVLMVFLMGCQEDLMPSNNPIESNSFAGKKGNTLDDISMQSTDGSSLQLSTLLNEHDGVVLYFTMWCPVCDSHMSHIQNQYITTYPNIKFVFIDYIASSLNQAKNNQQANGYQALDVVSDASGELQTLFKGTMATTVIIDKNFIVRLNQTYPNDQTFRHALEQLK